VRRMHKAIQEQIKTLDATNAVGIDDLLESSRPKLSVPILRVYVDGVGSVYEMELKRPGKSPGPRIMALDGASEGTVRVYYEPVKVTMQRVRLEKDGEEEEIAIERLDCVFDVAGLDDVLTAVGARAADRIEEDVSAQEFFDGIAKMDWNRGGVTPRFFVVEGRSRKGPRKTVLAKSSIESSRVMHDLVKEREHAGSQVIERIEPSVNVDPDFVNRIGGFVNGIPEMDRWTGLDVYELAGKMTELKLDDLETTAKAFHGVVMLMATNLVKCNEDGYVILKEKDIVDVVGDDVVVQKMFEHGILEREDSAVCVGETGTGILDFLKTKGVQVFNRRMA